MRLGVLFSGGKDSVLAMDRATDFHQVSCLITLVSSNRESYMFHTPSILHTTTQAEALGLPHVMRGTEGAKEEEVADLESAVRFAMEKYAIEGLVSGAIGSVYQATRVQKVCHNLGITSFNPLWQADQEDVLREMLAKGYRTIITGVFAYPLEEDMLGAVLDEVTVERLLGLRDGMGFNPAGEGGEIETYVLDGPLFRFPVRHVITGREFSNHAGTVTMETEVDG